MVSSLGLENQESFLRFAGSSPVASVYEEEMESGYSSRSAKPVGYSNQIPCEFDSRLFCLNNNTNTEEYTKKDFYDPP